MRFLTLWRTWWIDVFCAVLIVGVAAVTRFIFLADVPGNINGDEATNLIDMYRVLLGKHSGPFSFAGDGTEAIITVYWPVFLLFFTGITHSLLALRLSVSLLSIFALVGFYLVLRMKTNSWISLVFTCLLGANYVFLNFSRTGWVNMSVIFSGIFLLFFWELTEKKRNVFFAVLAGIFGGITFYGYHFGKILVIFFCVVLLIRFCWSRYRQKIVFQQVGFFFAALLLMLLPFLLTITITRAYPVLARPKAVLLFSPEILPSSHIFWQVFGNQSKLLFRGFFLLDGSVMSRGIENLRYVPLYSSPVDAVIKVFFWLGLAFCLVFAWRRVSWWWIVAVATLATEFVTFGVPNFARGLFYIPFIYLIAGIFFYRVLSFLQTTRFKPFLSSFMGVLLLLSVFLYYFNVSYFLSWMSEKRMLLAREPAIRNEEFLQWQQFQIDRMKVDELPVTNDEWKIIQGSN